MTTWADASDGSTLFSIIRHGYTVWDSGATTWDSSVVGNVAGFTTWDGDLATVYTTATDGTTVWA